MTITSTRLFFTSWATRTFSRQVRWSSLHSHPSLHHQRHLDQNHQSFFSTSSVRSESGLASLRKKTGYALNLCKKALQENANDVSAAEKWLREEAARHGWARASKLQARPTAEGLIGVFVNSDSSSGLLLEVNCETDFVARTDHFRSLVSNLTKTVADASFVSSNGQILPSDKTTRLVKYFLDTQQLDPLKEKLVTSISKLGENIVLKRALFIQRQRTSDASETENLPQVKLAAYAHSADGASNYLDGIHLGKYGTLLAYCQGAEEGNDDLVGRVRKKERKVQEREAPDEEGVDIREEDALMDMQNSFDPDPLSHEEVARLLCQHIIGMKPSKLRLSQEEMAEREKLRKLRKESGFKADDDEEESLLEQGFLLDQEITVSQLVRRKDMRILDFVKFECGITDS